MSTPTTQWRAQGDNLRAFTLYGFVPNGVAAGADFFGIAPVTATVTQNLGALTQTAVAVETFTATAAQHLGGLKQSATATETFTAAVAQHLGGLRQSATATETFAATIAQHLGALKQTAADVETFTATIAQKLGGLKQTATATETFSTNATITQKLGGLSQSARATNVPDQSKVAVAYWASKGLKPGAKVKNKYGQTGVVAYNKNGPFVIVQTKGFYRPCKISDWIKV